MKQGRTAHDSFGHFNSGLIVSARSRWILLAVLLLAAMLFTISASVFADGAGRLGSIRMTVPPGGDTFQMACRKLQQADADLRTEYADPNTTIERTQEIRGELQNLELKWQETGCQAVWGDIYDTLTPPFIPTRLFPPTLPVIRTPPAYPTTPPSAFPLRGPSIPGESTDHRHHDWIVIGGADVTSTPAVPPTPVAVG